MKPRGTHLIFFCSVALSGLTVFLPLVQMMVRVTVIQSTGYVYLPQQTTIRFWETHIPISDPTMVSREPSDTRCAASIAENMNKDLRQVLTFWQLVGWGSIFANVVVWFKLILVCRNRDADQKRLFAQLAWIGLPLCLMGAVALCILGPPINCPPAVVGVELEQVKAFWPTLLIGLASLVLGITANVIWPHSADTQSVVTT